MITSNDLADVFLREQVLRGYARLIIDQGDGALVVLALKREACGHHLERNVAAHVCKVFVTPADALDGADHFKPYVVEQDGSADRGSSGEEVPGQFVAEDDDVAFLRFVQTIKPAPLLDGKKPDLIELRLHADNLPVGSGEFANRTHIIASQKRRSVANVGSFPTDVRVVLVGKQIAAGGVHAACDHGRTAGEDKHDVFPVFGQPPLVSRAETFAQADE